MKLPRVPILSVLWLLGAAVWVPVIGAADKTVRELAVPTKATENKAPGWTKGGAFVYRLATPDQADVLPVVAEGFGITSHLLDGSVGQIPIIMGLIGHDHPGGFNWDGLWPYWDRVTYRAGDWGKLSAFMKDVRDRANTTVTFHVNFTDVNIGLDDYPESRAFFKKLVETKSIYRRDWNPQAQLRDGVPYVPKEIPADQKTRGPVPIYAIVNYKNFWDSGLAKEMIDSFYGHLPYAPPILYTDVLTPTGGNLNVGFPDGPLGGSKETQVEGMRAIAAYLRSKGTDLATEGNRPLVGEWGTYVWLHGSGVSADDYAVISGGDRQFPWQHVVGNTGAFAVSPVAATPGDLAKVREHYALLLAGKPSARKMPGLEKYHLSNRVGEHNEFDIIPGENGKASVGGDPFRGDWVDLVNHFYLVSIQELYHIGKKNVRTALYNRDGRFHLTRLVLTDGEGKESRIEALDFLASAAPEWLRKQGKKHGSLMLEAPYAGTPLASRFNAPKAGKYQVRVVGGGATGAMTIYANGRLQIALNNLVSKSQNNMEQVTEAGEMTLNAGDNLISLDTGALYAKWSDGTEAVWSEPGTYQGFKVTNGDVTYADGYDRMWPDTWSGQKKIYFFSWDGTRRTWKLPQDWADVKTATLYPLTPDGRGKGISLAIKDRSLTPRLLPQMPCVLVPDAL
ncbi:MAG TPA: glycoside hydrolase family 101 beta sandwich domain-containing protein [Roseimicrobium sp.]|nr:glycoside hydrolase family 101 beta sandwich domain-containing protein [Roseimicrobium sp.]